MPHEELPTGWPEDFKAFFGPRWQRVSLGGRVRRPSGAPAKPRFDLFLGTALEEGRASVAWPSRRSVLQSYSAKGSQHVCAGPTP